MTLPREQEIDKLIGVTKTKTTAPVTVAVDGFNCTVVCSYFDAKPFFSLWTGEIGEEWYKGTMTNSTMREGYMRSLLLDLKDGTRHIKRCEDGMVLLFNH